MSPSTYVAPPGGAGMGDTKANAAKANISPNNELEPRDEASKGSDPTDKTD